jgi:hypothetical protein
MAGHAPARVVSSVEPGGAAVVDVPDRPVEDDGHGKVVGPVEVLVDVVVPGTQPLGIHQEHVAAGRGGCILDWVSVLLLHVEQVWLEVPNSAGYGALAAGDARA